MKIRKRITHPLNELSSCAGSFAYYTEEDRRNNIAQLDALNIQTDDEIEDLYHSLQSMTRDSFEATANAFDEDVQQCLQAGMDAHLSKPVDIDQVTGLLSRMLASR